MPTKMLITQTELLIGKTAFIETLDALGWRGNYADDPASFLIDFLDEAPNKEVSDQMVRNDMDYALDLFGFEVVDGQIIDIVPR